MNFSTFSTPSPKEPLWGSFLPRTACRRDTPWTSPTRTKLAENLWNTFERLRATWISVELRNLLVTRHEGIITYLNERCKVESKLRRHVLLVCTYIYNYIIHVPLSVFPRLHFWWLQYLHIYPFWGLSKNRPPKLKLKTMSSIHALPLHILRVISTYFYRRTQTQTLRRISVVFAETILPPNIYVGEHKNYSSVCFSSRLTQNNFSFLVFLLVPDTK